MNCLLIEWQAEGGGGVYRVRPLGTVGPAGVYCSR